MKHYDWNPDKNAWLKLEREVSFEDVKAALEDDRLLDTVLHHNVKQYPAQKIFVVEIHGYAYLVPFVEDDEKIFFKTIIPNREATKKYLKTNKNKKT